MYDMIDINTEILCPNCAHGYMIRKVPRVIKSNTETYAYSCPYCGFVHTAKSDEDMQKWIESLDKPIEEKEVVYEFDGIYYKPKSKEKVGEYMNYRIVCRPDGTITQSTVDDHEESVNYHAKQDKGKAKLCLVPRRIIWDIAAIREYGNDKYPEGGPDNWKAVEAERYRNAAYRHFLAYLDDSKSVDSESGFPHLWHLACNIAFLCEMEDPHLNEEEYDESHNENR